MVKKIAILRGINVGGKRKILMADLKSMFSNLGFKDVITYIQSGNIIFESNLDDLELATQIENAILNKFKFEVPVIIRSNLDLEEAILSNPFYTNQLDTNNLHLTFLKELPNNNDSELINSLSFGSDKFAIIGQDVFVYCEGKYHESKLTNNFFEKKLKVGATTRNWKTVLKLLELSKI